MHKTPIDLRRLLPLVLLTLTLLTPSIVSAANSAQFADPEQPIPSEQLADIPRANDTPLFGYVYIVQSGDDIWQIAVAHGLDMEALAAENNLEPPYWLQPGDKLWVSAEPAVVRRPTSQPAPQTKIIEAAPAGTAEAAVASEEGAPVAQESSEDHTVAASANNSSGEVASDYISLSGIPEPAAQILYQMNQQRVERGLTSLSWSAELAQAAQLHAQDLAWRGWGSHVGSDGAYLRTRLSRAGYDYYTAGENWANARDSQHAFDMWWYEPPGADPHRQNILGSTFGEIGIGIAKGGWGYYFVADFGSR